MALPCLVTSSVRIEAVRQQLGPHPEIGVKIWRKHGYSILRNQLVDHLIILLNKGLLVVFFLEKKSRDITDQHHASKVRMSGEGFLQQCPDLKGRGVLPYVSNDVNGIAFGLEIVTILGEGGVER